MRKLHGNALERVLLARGPVQLLPGAAWARLLQQAHALSPIPLASQQGSSTATATAQAACMSSSCTPHTQAAPLASSSSPHTSTAHTPAASSHSCSTSSVAPARGVLLRRGGHWLGLRALSQAHSGNAHGSNSGGGWYRSSGSSSSSSGSPFSTAAAAAAVAAAGVMGGLSTSALADAGSASPVAAAQASVGAAWEEVSEDLQRLNARLPRRAAPLVGRPPKVAAVGSDGVEVSVPLREGADANAVLAELMEGFANSRKGGSSRSSSMQTRGSGAARTVHLDVREEGGSGKGGDGHISALLHMPSPAEQGLLTIVKRGTQGFSQQELDSLAQLVRTANLSFAPVQRGSLNHGPFASPFHTSSSSSSMGGSLFDEMQREMLGSFVSSGMHSMHGIMEQLMSEMAEAMEQNQGVIEEGTDAQDEAGWPGMSSQMGSMPMPVHRKKARIPEEEGYDWGSPQAAQAVKQLEGMGAQVYPPGKKDSLDWGGLAGYEEQKRMIEDCLLLPLMRPEVYESLTKATRQQPGSNRPRAVLFEGPPGTGKTTSARVISSQASVPLVYVPLEAVMSKWFGESEGLLAKVFKAAEALGGAIIFIDELDSLGGSRERGDMHEASRRLLSVLLREMDGFDAHGKRAIVVGSTNRKSDLDPALISRFDLSVTFGMPDENCRALILKQYAQQLSSKELQQLAAAAGPTSGRDLRDLCEVAERRWASKIIRKEAKEGSLPPLKEYLAAATERLATIKQSQAGAARAAHPLSFLPPRF